MKSVSRASACPCGSGVACAAILLPLLLAAALPAQDTVVVHADGPPAWGPDVHLVAEFALGALDGPPEYAFGEIDNVAVEKSGGFYLYDGQDVQIRHYDRNGRFTALVGRKGSGPGEYRGVTGIDIVRDSLLLVCDAVNSRMTVFGPDGEMQSEAPVERGSLGGLSPDCTVGRNGLIYRDAARIRVPMPNALQYLRFRLDGTLVDSLFVGRIGSNTWVLLTSDGARHAFPAESLGAPWTGGGVLRGWSMEYRIAIVTPDGHVTLIERKMPRVALSGPERAEWVAWDKYIHETHPSELPTPIPREKPYFRGLMSDHLGRIWVHLYSTAEKRKMAPRPPGDPRPLLTWKERNTYDVFSPEGRYLGRVELPAETMLLAVRDDRVFLRMQGAQGEERIGVFGIRASARR